MTNKLVDEYTAPFPLVRLFIETSQMDEAGAAPAVPTVQQRKAPYDEDTRFRIHNNRLNRSEQRPHTPAGQIAEALQDAAEYRKAAQLYMPDGRPDPLSKDAARDMVAKARSVRLDGPKP